MKKNIVKISILFSLVLTVFLSSIAIGAITDYSNTKTIKQSEQMSPDSDYSNTESINELEQMKPDNNYPVKIYNENKELVLETTMQNYLDNREQIEKNIP